MAKSLSSSAATSTTAAAGKSSSPSRRGRGNTATASATTTDTNIIDKNAANATDYSSTQVLVSLANRKREIQSRLKELEVRTTMATTTTIHHPLLDEFRLSKLPTATPLPQQQQHPTKSSATDTHRDYALKELAWLSADYQSERKRQISQAKKISNAILQYHASLHLKKARDRSLFQSKLRRLSNKLNSIVQHHYWKKNWKSSGI